jgi:glycerol-3-phosphate dehydrogenase
VRPSQGIHLFIDQRFLGGGTAVMIPKTEDGRVLFLIPWKSRPLVGTTDTEGVEGALHPRPLAEEIVYLIRHVGGYLEERPTHGDIRAIFAGLHPLAKPPRVRAGRKSTAALSRGYVLYASDSGLVTVTGGKWTTCRQMAEEAVDRAAEMGGLPKRGPLTAELALLVPREDRVSEKLDPALPYQMHQIDRAVREEMAMTLDDVLARRTRCAFFDEEATRRCAPKVAARMAGLLGRGEDRIRSELEPLQRGT